MTGAAARFGIAFDLPTGHLLPPWNLTIQRTCTRFLFRLVKAVGQAKLSRRPLLVDVTRLTVGALDAPTLEERHSVCHALTRHGCVHVTGLVCGLMDPSRITAGWGVMFGQPIHHRLSDERGVHPIRNIPGYPSYANTTSADLLLHTDGSFEPNSPLAMLLLCEKPAGAGGLTRICDAEAILRHLVKNHPETLPGLYLPDAFTIRRDDRQSAKPVFRQCGDRTIFTFRFGSDVKIDVHPRAREGFAQIEAYLRDPAHFAEFRLERGDLLIVDNSRVLHGRTEFPQDSDRMLHGLWLDGVTPPAFDVRFGIPSAEFDVMPSN